MGSERAEAKFKLEQTGKSAQAVGESSAALNPGASSRHVWRVPFTPISEAAAWANEDPDVWLERTVAYWRGLLNGAAQIDVPCRKATET